MAITRERFEQGLTYERWLDVMTKSRDKFEENVENATIDDAALKAFAELREPVNVAVIAEDWCGDVIANFPILARIARDTGKLNMRVFLRDQNTDLIDQYLKQGKFRAIPVFIFLDEQFRELGHFIERPDSVTELRAKRRAEIFAANPEFGPADGPIENLAEDVRGRLQADLAKIREETLPFANSEVVKRFRDIVSNAIPA